MQHRVASNCSAGSLKENRKNIMAIGNMKIGVRLGLGFAALLGMQLVTTGLGMREMASSAARVASCRVGPCART